MPRSFGGPYSQLHDITGPFVPRPLIRLTATRAAKRTAPVPPSRLRPGDVSQTVGAIQQTRREESPPALSGIAGPFDRRRRPERRRSMQSGRWSVECQLSSSNRGRHRHPRPAMIRRATGHTGAPTARSRCPSSCASAVVHSHVAVRRHAMLASNRQGSTQPELSAADIVAPTCLARSQASG